MKTKRNGFIELCRFIFMLTIVSHHAILFPNYGRIAVFGGYVSVEFFFMLSGFFLAKSAEKNHNSTESGIALKEAIKPIKGIYGYFIVVWLASFSIWHYQNGNTLLSEYLYHLIRGIPQMLFLGQSGMGGQTEGLFAFVGTTWYLEAIVIAILFCYPLMRRWTDSYFSTAAPLLSMLIYGKIMMTVRSFGAVNETAIICNYSILRAIAGLSLGSFCYYLSKQMPEVSLTKAGNNFLGMAQIGLVALILFLMNNYSGFNDVIIVLMFGALIIISMSADTWVNDFCNNRFCYWLGKFSASIFVTHQIVVAYPIMPYPERWRYRYILYFVYALAASGLVMLLVDTIKKLFSHSSAWKWIWEMPNNQKLDKK